MCYPVSIQTSFTNYYYRRLIIFICVSIYARAENCLTVSVRKGTIMKRESSTPSYPPPLFLIYTTVAHRCLFIPSLPPPPPSPLLALSPLFLCVEKKSLSLNRDAASLVRTIFKAVKYIHDSGIVHRGIYFFFFYFFSVLFICRVFV